MTPKILIVDDELNILILMEQILEDLESDYGIELLKAQDGEEALELAHREKPQLIFLDIMLPKLSGLEVCQRLKQDPETQSNYIVLLTAKGQSFDKENGLLRGADLYLTKPFRPKEILQLSKTILALP